LLTIVICIIETPL